MIRMLRGHSFITYTVWAILIVASVAAFVLGDLMIGAVGLATLALSFAPAFMAERWHLKIPVYFYSGIVLFLFGTVFLGEAFNFYERFWWWDLFLHGTSAMGFGIVGVVLTLLMFEGDQYAAPPYAVAGISFSFAVTIGAVWEIFEFGMDQLFGMNMQKSGLVDTMTDLMVDCFGAGLAAMSGYAFLKFRSRYGLSAIISEFILRNRRFFRRAAREIETDGKAETHLDRLETHSRTMGVGRSDD
ncbi:hypothetical protein BD830_103547 [Maritimibacter alkaliphilus HTCC2654]|jgi:hypothetical protein|uniref:Uncharacterized protein n=2 Tax=Maritimibacter TaxID=404235 RepID=A3VDT4_9RHOB|nr:hypothetical protein [Maritimibacter alkaliphilus]EAQ13673.1 hypothetical protein RB2654_03129 [Maritimibacter alkaliphilus HTCC2654]TYP83510.1 hypothetical protein BD830_103547 [Maritimibacter alkaliphilus HTCC2654]